MRRNAIWKLRAAALSVALFGLSAAPAGAAEQITLGTVGQASANLWPVLDRARPRASYTAEDLKVDIVYVQSSAALVQQVTAGSLAGQHLDRARRSAARRRHGRADLHRPHRSAGAALRSRRQAGHQEPRRSQGQADLARRPEGHHPHLCRAHAGAERRQAGRVRHGVRRRNRGARLGADSPARSMPQFCCRRSISRRRRRASRAWASRRITSKTCRSPAWR